MTNFSINSTVSLNESPRQTTKLCVITKLRLAKLQIKYHNQIS